MNFCELKTNRYWSFFLLFSSLLFSFLINFHLSLILPYDVFFLFTICRSFHFSFYWSWNYTQRWTHLPFPFMIFHVKMKRNTNNLCVLLCLSVEYCIPIRLFWCEMCFEENFFSVLFRRNVTKKIIQMNMFCMYGCWIAWYTRREKEMSQRMN